MFQSKLEVYFRYKDLFEKDPKDWTLEEFEDFCAELGECTFCPFNDNADRTECTNFYIIRDGKRLLDEYKKEVHETLQEVVSTAQSVSITKWTPTNIKPKDLVGLAINSSFNISTQENLYRVDYFYSPYQDKVIMKPFADLSVGEVYISMSVITHSSTAISYFTAKKMIKDINQIREERGYTSEDSVKRG